MTTKECRSRDLRTIERVMLMLRVHQRLCRYSSTLQVSMEDAMIVLRGELPSGDLKKDLLPTIRKSGFLGRVTNLVVVNSQTA